MSERPRWWASPWPYAAWTGIVLAMLGWSYVEHPYLFMLAILVLSGLSAIVAIAGVVAITRPESESRARALIGASVAVTATALFVAYRVLGTFKWA